MQRNRERVVLELCLNLKWLRFFRFFGDPLEQVITLRGQILVSRTDDDPSCSPCVHSKRPRVYWHHAWCRHARGRFERTHGDVLNVTHGDVLDGHTTPPKHHDNAHNHTHKTFRRNIVAQTTCWETYRNRPKPIQNFFCEHFLFICDAPLHQTAHTRPIKHRLRNRRLTYRQVNQSSLNVKSEQHASQETTTRCAEFFDLANSENGPKSSGPPPRITTSLGEQLDPAPGMHAPEQSVLAQRVGWKGRQRGIQSAHPAIWAQGMCAPLKRSLVVLSMTFKRLLGYVFNDDFRHCVVDSSVSLFSFGR